MCVQDDHVGAVNLSEVVLTNHEQSIKYNGILTENDLKYQEARRQRRVRKLDFEER